jgi:catechol 2,3-dioxygenase-like lactoylglutathione lyase family enzyme
MTTTFHELEHVQLAMSPGDEETARRFYEDVLGMRVVPKPEGLRASEGIWFAAGAFEIHLRAEEPRHPSRAAHPAIRLTGLDTLAARCATAGHAPEFDTRYPGRRRFYVRDPFDNRIEFFEIVDA